MRILLVFICMISLHGFSQQRKQYEVYFDSGKALLNNSAFDRLDSLYKTIDTSRIRSIYIYGYCDSVGNVEYNKALSDRRAETVKSFFVSKGLKADSVILKGFGKSIQKYQSDKWDMNRRVSFEICYKKAPKKPVVASSTKPIKQSTDTIKTKIEQFVEKAEVGDKIALRNITFYGGTPDPMPESAKTLKELLKTLKNNPTLEICIEGHICCHSTDNDDLSGRRARAVYDYLVEGGIDKNRLSYKGFGRTQPLTQERTSAEQQMNRRVEIRVTKK